jgi:hypothetical protein
LREIGRNAFLGVSIPPILPRKKCSSCWSIRKFAIIPIWTLNCFVRRVKKARKCDRNGWRIDNQIIEVLNGISHRPGMTFMRRTNPPEVTIRWCSWGEEFRILNFSSNTKMTLLNHPKLEIFQLNNVNRINDFMIWSIIHSQKFTKTINPKSCFHIHKRSDSLQFYSHSTQNSDCFLPFLIPQFSSLELQDLKDSKIVLFRQNSAIFLFGKLSKPRQNNSQDRFLIVNCSQQNEFDWWWHWHLVMARITSKNPIKPKCYSPIAVNQKVNPD